jgi:hypothetical protein
MSLKNFLKLIAVFRYKIATNVFISQNDISVAALLK